jgi:hypothetical protein
MEWKKDLQKQVAISNENSKINGIHQTFPFCSHQDEY